MPLSVESVETAIGKLVDGMTGLRADGRFNEPNLDGTPGDYVSFDAWEWPQGVGLYGLVRFWQFNRDPAVLKTLEGWYAGHLDRPLPSLNVNTSAPMLALSILWRETRNPRWVAPMQAWAERMVTEMPRTPEGGFQHNVSDKINDNELWDDTLFMAALFLASFGQASGQRRFVDEAVCQFLVHSRYLTDTKTGLWFHGWTFDGRHNFARALWARGNSWITVCILDLIELAGLEGGVREFLLGVVEAQIYALLKLQGPSGAFHTLLDDPDSYEEMSATAGIGYGLMKAARLGVGPAGCRAAGLRALNAVLAHIGPDGILGQVSYGTRMGRDLQFYRDIPIQPTGYGQALAIMCLAEALNHLDKDEEAA